MYIIFWHDFKLRLILDILQYIYIHGSVIYLILTVLCDSSNILMNLINVSKQYIIFDLLSFYTFLFLISVKTYIFRVHTRTTAESRLLQSTTIC